MEFFGRESELNELLSLWGKRGGSLVTCRGRRRIGKSTLLEEFARRSKARFIKIEGARPKPGYANATELEFFARSLAVQSRAEDSVPANWLRAFVRLDREISDGERTVVLLDEVSWLGHYDATFADTVKSVWDDYWSKHDRLVVVVCGSVSGWIRDNFIDNGAFLGRRSLDLVVKELPLTDCVKFWGKKVGRIETREMLDVLSVTGGVPRYLKEVRPGLSAAENIQRMAFRSKSVLREDFDEMFSDVITRQPTLAGKVIRKLVGGALSLTEVAKALKMEKGGKLTDVLDQLTEAGLVASDVGKNPQTGQLARERRYRLQDNYARFYLRYIEPSKDVIDAGAYSFVALDGLDGWNAIMGLQFENLVINNLPALLGPMNVRNALVESAAPYRRGKNKAGAGVQIDLLVQTKRAHYVVEVKRQREIGREVIGEVESKVAKFGHPQGKSIRTALVYDGALAPIVETDGYFDALIPFRSLLGV